MDHLKHLVYSKVMISFGNPSILSDFCHFFNQKVHRLFPRQRACIWMKGVLIAWVLGQYNQDRKVSAKSVIMIDTTF